MVIQCKLFKKDILAPIHRKKNFGHPWRSSSGKGHQRSSSAKFQKVYFRFPMHRKRILGIMPGQNQVKFTNGHQVQIHITICFISN